MYITRYKAINACLEAKWPFSLSVLKVCPSSLSGRLQKLALPLFGQLQKLVPPSFRSMSKASHPLRAGLLIRLRLWPLTLRTLHDNLLVHHHIHVYIYRLHESFHLYFFVCKLFTQICHCISQFWCTIYKWTHCYPYQTLGILLWLFFTLRVFHFSSHHSLDKAKCSITITQHLLH